MRLNYHRVHDGYVLDEKIVYYSKRYKKTITVPLGRRSDGATGARDIPSLSWWVHDEICFRCEWDDGDKISRWQGSSVLFDILWSEKQFVEAISWRWATFFAGCKRCRWF